MGTCFCCEMSWGQAAGTMGCMRVRCFQPVVFCCAPQRTSHEAASSGDCHLLPCALTSPGIAAATIFSPTKDLEVSENQLRVAFDGDAVLFSDESEQIVKAHGLDMFFEHEKAHENKPLAQVVLGCSLWERDGTQGCSCLWERAGDRHVEREMWRSAAWCCWFWPAGRPVAVIFGGEGVNQHVWLR